jgi:bacillithiol synthase
MKIERCSLAGSTLVQDWLTGDPRATPFYPGDPFDLETYLALSAQQEDRFATGGRSEAAALLQGGGPDRDARLRRFVDEDGFLVTTGQQPVLFGGPLYVLYKALTAVELARSLEHGLGRPILPVFWVASEDHDWEEARQVHLLDQANELKTIELPPREGASPALHRIPLGTGAGADSGTPPGDDLRPPLQALLEALPETDFSPPWRTALGSAWSPGTTLAAGFLQSLKQLLAPFGMFFVEAHDSSLRRLSRPLLLEELRHSRRSQEVLAERNRRLVEAGYDLQVPLLGGATNVFVDGEEGRERLLDDGSEGFVLRGSRRKVPLDDLVQGNAGVDLSPNVLLRPVVEAHVLPTLAYVAGPGEAAYLAQSEALFSLHGVPRPVVCPRASFRLIEGKVGKVLQKFDLQAAELARPHHELTSALAREDVPDDIRRELGAMRGALAQGVGRLSQAVANLDPTLKPSVEQVRSQGFSQLDEVEKKVIQALKREKEVLLAQLAKAQSHLFPDGRPQERVMSPWYYLFRYGPDFLDQLQAEVRTELSALEAGLDRTPA